MSFTIKKEGKTAMARRIYVTEKDLQKLKKLLIDQQDNLRDQQQVDDLEHELARAQVVPEGKLPDDVITMNSRAVLRVDGAEDEVTLVYPGEADALTGLISVLSPIGTAILGYREGDRLEWRVPSGIAQVEVVRVLYQPEAAGKAAREDGR
jgi:regulator of nucleoside diphosphate kinase